MSRTRGVSHSPILSLTQSNLDPAVMTDAKGLRLNLTEIGNFPEVFSMKTLITIIIDDENVQLIKSPYYRGQVRYMDLLVEQLHIALPEQQVQKVVDDYLSMKEAIENAKHQLGVPSSSQQS